MLISGKTHIFECLMYFFSLKRKQTSPTLLYLLEYKTEKNPKTTTKKPNQKPENKKSPWFTCRGFYQGTWIFFSIKPCLEKSFFQLVFVFFFSFQPFVKTLQTLHFLPFLASLIITILFSNSCKQWGVPESLECLVPLLFLKLILCCKLQHSFTLQPLT